MLISASAYLKRIKPHADINLQTDKTMAVVL